MPDHHNLHRRKALIALAGTDAAFAAGRYDNAVGRAYYYCFHLAVAARIAAGQAPDRALERWRHGVTFRALDRLLQEWGEAAEFSGLLSRIYTKRVQADYGLASVLQHEAAETIEQANRLGAAIERHVPFRQI